MLPEFVRKYLSKQDLGKWNLEFHEDRGFNNIIVIPALDELNTIPLLFNSLSQNSLEYLSDTLILVVVNSNSNTNDYVKSENYLLLEQLKTGLVEKNPKLNIGYIDASSQNKELPIKNGGVGFARKIGLDLALEYFNYSNSEKNLLISLDADCIVSSNYLEEIVMYFDKQDFNAATVEYEHVFPDDPIQKAAIINYEIFLRYYILGLKYSGSRYAHHAIGSIIICDAESYVKVGGMNKRKAGEDFYFLEKLAKISKLGFIKNTKVFPSARLSHRVPFGTGKRIQRFIDKDMNEYTLYSPEIFRILKKWLELFDNKLNHSDKLKPDLILKYILESARNIEPHLNNFLVEQNFYNDLHNVMNNSKTDKQLKTQKNNWMDGFRTLKLIHYLRDHKYPNINMFEAINKLLKTMNQHVAFESKESIPSIEIQYKYLMLLRELV